MKKTYLIMFCMILSACSTMKFVNGPKMKETVVREKWHHLGFNGIIEFSKPMNINYHCGMQQWDTITIEKTLVNGLAANTLPYVTMYSPWTIVYECRNSID